MYWWCWLQQSFYLDCGQNHVCALNMSCSKPQEQNLLGVSCWKKTLNRIWWTRLERKATPEASEVPNSRLKRSVDWCIRCPTAGRKPTPGIRGVQLEASRKPNSRHARCPTRGMRGAQLEASKVGAQLEASKVPKSKHERCPTRSIKGPQLEAWRRPTRGMRDAQLQASTMPNWRQDRCPTRGAEVEVEASKVPNWRGKQLQRHQRCPTQG